MNDRSQETPTIPSHNRRTFLKVSGTAASAAMASRIFTASSTFATSAEGVALSTGESLPDEIESAEDIMYSVCQMCHSRCGIRAKVKEGILVKLDGNPYHPNNRDVDEHGVPDRLGFATPPEEAVRELGRLCLKGQAGVQTVYDPLRIQHPLKRVGPRHGFSRQEMVRRV